MPTYSYRCTQCDHAFDIHQQFSDASLTECPSCGGKLRKVFGSLGVTFNGSGFYRTDSRSSSKPVPSTSASDAGGSSSSS
ncbi:FmdB family zinc ribbon protein [Paramicrobacterium sp. CJ85]|uniref:FmdB family zinc ribbon protein n=1 Tax=Paramicrobacterium sp. CJ85 TaxID=3445355 RepID=UPI003F63C45B